MTGVLLYSGTHKALMLDAGRKLAANSGMPADAMDGLLTKVMTVARNAVCGGKLPMPDNDEEDG